MSCQIIHHERINRIKTSTTLPIIYDTAEEANHQISKIIAANGINAPTTQYRAGVGVLFFSIDYYIEYERGPQILNQH